MKSDAWLIVIIAMLAIVPVSCSLHITSFDVAPPAAPREVRTFAGDNLVRISWVENTERDLAGYNVYVVSHRRENFRLIGSTRGVNLIDRGVVNGRTYYYAVSAYDFDGNESDLSVDPVGVTPRPEGRNVTLFNYRSIPSRAGYDFSAYSVVPYDDKYTDIYFDYFNGVPYMRVWDDTDIQDMGYTASLDEIRVAPEKGWSPTGAVHLITGHTYVVWTWDDHYAKFRVTSVTPQRVVFDWAYQLQKGNPFLKRKVDSDRGPLSRARGRSE